MGDGEIANAKVAYHRNGVGGAGFHVVLFSSKDASGAARDMLGIVFDEPGHVAVLDAKLLAVGEIRFTVNSWRGDEFEPGLRRAVTEWFSEESPFDGGGPR